MKTYCNPLNISYRFMRSERRANQPCREGSDPALILFGGRYWLATSKTSGLHWSDDLSNWHYIPSRVLPAEGYGPDFWINDGRLYYVNGAENGEIFRTVAPEHDQWEKVGAIGYLPDPKIFVDDGGRTYLYWGSGVNSPLQVRELNSRTFAPLGEPIALNVPNPQEHGWERSGENNFPVDNALAQLGIHHPDLPNYRLESYNEGAWMTRYHDRYYLQNSIPATEFNIYCDAISVGDAPTGPFTFQADNPFSLKPGGYINGAGHSCSFFDRYGNLFHASTMRVTRHHVYERRIGLFPAGFYPDGTMYCQTRFGDWPHFVPREALAAPAALFAGWMLLSYRVAVTASSQEAGFEGERVVNEDVRTYWAAAADDPAPEVTLTLPCESELRALQINFAEHHCERNFDESPTGCARFTVESSRDGNHWELLWDQRNNQEDKTHCYCELNAPISASRLRVRIFAMANGGRAALSGVRVFGHAPVPPPAVPDAIRVRRRADDLTIADVNWQLPENAIGVNVLWGLSVDRLHHCWQTLNTTSLSLSSLDARQSYFVALEAFGPGGVAIHSVAVEI